MTELAKILCFVNDSHEDKLHVVAMTLNGDVLRTETVRTVSEGKVLISDEDSRAVYIARFPDGFRPVWIDNPAEHAEAIEASRLHAEKTAPTETPLLPTSGEMRMIYESQNLCRMCTHQAMCGISLAIEAQAEREEYVVLGGCTMLETVEGSTP